MGMMSMAVPNSAGVAQSGSVSASVQSGIPYYLARPDLDPEDAQNYQNTWGGATQRAANIYAYTAGINQYTGIEGTILGGIGLGMVTGPEEIAGSLAAEGAAEEFSLTNIVAEHAGDVIKRGALQGQPARPFINSPLLMKEIMQAGEGVADPGGVVGALRWDVAGTFQGTAGTWEFVFDPATNTVLHSNFVVP